MSIEYNIESFFPRNFFNRSVNEPFIKTILQVVYKGNWRQGEHLKREPDYFCNDIPIEFTLACDRDTTNNYIQQLKQGTFETEDIEATVIEQINERIADKATRKYSVSNVHLCVLITLPMVDWVLDYYGSRTQIAVDTHRSEAFKLIRQNYIDNNTFTNIYIMFPDLCASWWVYEVKTEKRSVVQLEPELICSNQFPYILLKEKER